MGRIVAWDELSPNQDYVDINYFIGPKFQRKRCRYKTQGPRRVSSFKEVMFKRESSKRKFKEEVKQAGNGPSQRHIQSSKIAKGLQNFQVLVNWDYFYGNFFERSTVPKKSKGGTFWSGPVLYVTRETFLVQFLGPTGTFWGLLNFVELLVELFWPVQVVLKNTDEKP